MAPKLRLFTISHSRGEQGPVDAIESNSGLTQLLEDAVSRSDGDQIQVGELIDQLGDRSYGPVLFLFALIELLPFLSIIPGMYIITASVLILLSAQMFVGRPRPWLPKWITRRSFPRNRLRDGISRWRPWLKWLETLVRPRWGFLVKAPFLQIIAATCILLALSFFPLSPIPASEKVPALPVAFFALAITARDGLLAIIGFAITGISIGSLIYFWPTVMRALSEGLDFVGF